MVFIDPRPVPGDTVEFSALYAVPVLIVIVTHVNISVITYDSQNMPKVTLGVLQSICNYSRLLCGEHLYLADKKMQDQIGETESNKKKILKGGLFPR